MRFAFLQEEGDKIIRGRRGGGEVGEESKRRIDKGRNEWD